MNGNRRNIRIILNFIIGPVIFLALSYSLYRQILKQEDLDAAWLRILNSFQSPNILYLIAIPFLMLANWSLEAIKWQLSVQFLQPVSFFTAFRAIFSGVSFSVILPNRVGEYVGRALYMNEGKRLRAIPLTILASCSQMIITFLFGLLGLIFLKDEIVKAQSIEWTRWIDIVLFGGAIVLAVLLFFFFRTNWVAEWLSSVKALKKYTYITSELGNINATLALKLLSLSVLRYGVFMIQYYFAYRFFDVECTFWQAAGCTSLMFLLLAMLPTIALAELGLRGEISLRLMTMFSSNLLGIGFTSLIIWFINLFIPAAIGSLLILGIKIFRNRNEGG